MTFSRLRTPYMGACLHDQWYFAAGNGITPADPKHGVPNIFLLTVVTGNTQNLTVGVDFAGRGLVGFTGCGAGVTTDTYVGGSGSSKSIDVWKAYAQGVWTSSTTAVVYLRKSAASGPVTNCTYRGRTFNQAISFSGPLTGPNAIPWVDTAAKTPDFFITPPAAGCPTTPQFTVTFYDDGTWTLA